MGGDVPVAVSSRGGCGCVVDTWLGCSVAVSCCC